jgi:hypothetical protein
MSFFVVALLSFVAFSPVLVTSTKDNYKIHICGRTPPLEGSCRQIGQDRTDEGKALGIYSCPA